MIIADIGTSYTKIRNIETRETKIVPTINLNGFKADYACGHNAKRFSENTFNELVCLAKGAESLIKEEDFVCVDVGSRDIKYVEYKNGKFKNSNWNYQCGAMAGFTLEMLQKALNIDYNTIHPSKDFIPFTCGILGISAVFDLISSGVPKEEAVSRLVKGLTKSILAFTKNPQKLYISGGICENNLFLSSFDVEVVPLGRDVLLLGLERLINEK